MAKLIGKDVTVLSVGGTSILATYQECTLVTEVNMIDVSAAADVARSFRPGSYGWTVTCRKRKEASAAFAALVLTGGTASISFTEDASGKVYTGTGYLSRAESNFGALDTAQEENITVQGSGGLTVT